MSDIISRQLTWLLQPIQPYLEDPKITDIHINGPNQDGKTTTLFFKRGSERGQAMAPLTLRHLENIGDNAAALMRQDVAEDAPFCSARLPAGQRLQIVRPPAVPDGRYALAIRRPAARSWTPDELEAAGVFAQTRTAELARMQPRAVVLDLLAMKNSGKWKEMISLAIRHGFNVLWAGKVGTGKTHNLRAFMHAVPLDWRIVTVEDMEEVVNLPHKNVVNLLYPKGKGQGVSRHTAEDCTEAALRLDMDILINQELRDAASWAYLRALNSGHPGMTSCHAPSAEGAFKAVGLMVRQHESGKTMSNEDLQAALRELIDVVAYCEIVDGVRRVTQVYFEPDLRKGMPIGASSALAA
jgi:type IV secretion system protein VirB11